MGKQACSIGRCLSVDGGCEYVNVHCPNCQQLLVVSPAQAGQVIACPHCQNSLQIPAATLVTPFTAASPSTPNSDRTVGPGEIQISTDPLPSRRRGQSASGRRSIRNDRTRGREGDDTLNKILAFLGAGILLIGVFCPFMTIGGFSLDCFDKGKGIGVTILLLAGASVGCALVGELKFLWFTSITAIWLPGFEVMQFLMLKSDAKRALRDSPFGDLAGGAMNQMSVGWGFAVLFLGALLVVSAAAIPVKPRR